MMIRIMALSICAAALSMPLETASASSVNGCQDHGKCRHLGRHVVGPRDYARQPDPVRVRLLPGTVDAACNLPTSACPNDRRDVN